MKDLNTLNEFRQIRQEINIAGCPGDSENGIFIVSVCGKSFYVVASTGGGWEHVSVSPVKGKNCPTWTQMCAIKDMFFEEEEVVIQYHPAKSQYVNICNNCLHLWRPVGIKLPVPPKSFV